MPLTLTEAIDAAKKALDIAGYAYWMVTSGKVSDDDSKWILEINGISRVLTVTVDRNTGEVLELSSKGFP